MKKVNLKIKIINFVAFVSILISFVIFFNMIINGTALKIKTKTDELINLISNNKKLITDNSNIDYIKLGFKKENIEFKTNKSLNHNLKNIKTPTIILKNTVLNDDSYSDKSNNLFGDIVKSNNFFNNIDISNKKDTIELKKVVLNDAEINDKIESNTVFRINNLLSVKIDRNKNNKIILSFFTDISVPSEIKSKYENSFNSNNLYTVDYQNNSNDGIFSIIFN